MGKYVLLVVFGSLSIWGLSMAEFQGQSRAVENEAEHYHGVLARQAARTGLNVIRARAARASNENQCPGDIVEAVSAAEGVDRSGGRKEGRYSADLQPVPSLKHSFRAVSEGRYKGKTASVKELVTTDHLNGGFFYVEEGGPGRLNRYPAPSGDGFETHPQVQAMGPLALDIDGDGREEIPYARKSNRKIEMIDPETKSAGKAQTLVNANKNGRAAPATSKTQIATGKWGGDQPSVFYANADGDGIYRVSWSTRGNGKNRNDPELIASMDNSRNGADAVVGVADVNGDSDEELVFVDGSQELRYMDRPEDGDQEEGDHEPGTGFPKIPGGSVGSSDGIGAGSLVDLNGDGTSSVVFVNGSNNIRIANDAGTSRTIRVDNTNGGNGPGAAKAPPAVLDIDGDGSLEVAYVVNGGNQVQYASVDPENRSSPDIATIEDLSVDQEPGLQASSMSPCGN